MPERDIQITYQHSGLWRGKTLKKYNQIFALPIQGSNPGSLACQAVAIDTQVLVQARGAGLENRGHDTQLLTR